MARLCPAIRVSCRCVIDVKHLHCMCMLYKINSNWNNLFSQFPSATVRDQHTGAATAAHPLEFEITRCRLSQFAGCFLPSQTRVWNNLLSIVFVTVTFDGYKGSSQSLVASLSNVYHFSMAQVLVGLRKQFINNFVFSTWACAAGFNNNNNNNN